MAVSLKIWLVYIVFSYIFFKLPVKCKNICVTFLKNVSIEFTIICFDFEWHWCDESQCFAGQKHVNIIIPRSPISIQNVSLL